MKKNFILAIAATATCMFSAAAQAVETPSVTDNVYIGIQGGITTPLSHNPFFDSMRGMAGLEIGKQLTPVFGVGAEGVFGVNTSNWNGRIPSKTAFDNSYVGAYSTVDLFNLFGGYPCKVRPFDIAAQFGIGWGHFYQTGMYEDLNFISTKFGLNFNFNVSDHVTIALKPSVIYNLNNHATGQTNFNVNRATFQMLAGLNYRFGDGFKCVRPYDEAEVANLNQQVNELRALALINAEQAAGWQAQADALAVELENCRNQAPQVQVVHDVTNQYNSVRFVFFQLGSSTITADQMPNVTMIADYMNSHPDSKVVIKGYASRDGNYDFNVRLAQKRAEAVKTALTTRYRIPADRIQAIGEGIGNMFEEESWNRVSICTLETEAQQ